jgi:hypothetical protein
MVEHLTVMTAGPRVVRREEQSAGGKAWRTAAERVVLRAVTMAIDWAGRMVVRMVGKSAARRVETMVVGRDGRKACW